MLIKDNEKQSYDSVAEKVCDGWFGNGVERRKNLEAAGYDYNAIQSIVNEKMMTKSMEEIRSKNRNMSNYRILKAMITECLNSNDISYINMILNLAEIIVDDAINQNEDNNAKAVASALSALKTAINSVYGLTSASKEEDESDD